MKQTLTVAAMFAALCHAQKPSDPKYFIQQEAPLLDYRFEPNNGLQIPAGFTFGFPGNVTFDKQGNLWVLNRGPVPVTAFDPSGKMIKSFGGDGMFGNRPHALRVDPDGNIWVMDGSTHIVVKMDQSGKVLLTLEIGRAHV